MNANNLVRDIADIIQQGYGGYGGMGMDRAIAGQIVQWLEMAGYMSADEVALIVKAAGGEVRVSEKDLVSGPRVLRMWREPDGTIVFKSVSTEIVNHEIVDSGPIKVRMTS